MIVNPRPEGWAYPNDLGQSKLHYYRGGRTLCRRWSVAVTRPKPMAERIGRLWLKGWVCERCWSIRRPAVKAS